MTASGIIPIHCASLTGTVPFGIAWGIIMKTAAFLFLVLFVAASAVESANAETGVVAEPAVALTEMVLIPAAEFDMTGPGGDEGPETHRVSLDAFYIDTHEVTNAQYHAFCKATGREMHTLWGIDELRSSLAFPDHPVHGISWHDARDYAKWAGKRLPTEAEWEYAARGGLVGKRWDRGDVLEPHDANWKKSDLGGTVAVGSYEPNGYGLYDTVGNLREWVSDRWSEDYFRESPADNPQGPAPTIANVLPVGG